MINQNSIQATSNLNLSLPGSPYPSEHFIRPAYSDYCFAHLPTAIQRIFGMDVPTLLPDDVLPSSGPYECLVFMLVDAFGWMFLEKYADDFPFLREMLQNGTVSRLTSMFPSTTSAHVTCVYTGLPVGQSGVYEWYYYEPTLDMVISPLLFTPAGDKMRDMLKEMGVQPADLFPDQTLFHLLERGEVHSHVFTPIEYSRSTYNTHVTRGAEIIPYITWSEALTNLCLLLERKKKRKLYAFLYFSGLDAIGHPYGPSAPHTENEIITFLMILERFLSDLRRSALGRRMLLLMSADHGIAMTDPKTTIYLNQRFPGIESSFVHSRNGQPILFGGSPRDLFLYIQPEKLAEVQQNLAQALAGKAEVYRTADLLQEGIFGPLPVSEVLLARLGNLVILPYNGEAVTWYEKGKFEQKYRGHHGGLTAQEMLIPLLAYPLA